MAGSDNGSSTAGAVSESSTETKRAQLESKLAEATSHYAHKDYAQAAELYSEATELQDELNGEMHPDNAYLLYLYGRCLYHVAVSKSDVLGGKAAAESTQNGGEDNRGKKRKAESSNGEGSSAQGAVAPEAESGTSTKGAQKSKSNVQIEGDDADWDDELQPGDDDDNEDDGLDEDEEADKNAEEEEDDFAIAYEVLDIARILLTRQIEVKEQEQSGKDAKSIGGSTKAAAPSALEPPKTLYAVRELLADTHDLQAEICLENERFEEAIADSTASLALKQELYPKESSLVAEAHYKLSLALEFASVTKEEAEQVDVNMIASVLGGQGGGSSGAGKKEQDEQIQKEKAEKRRKAANNMEAAIESSKLRVKLEREELSQLTAGSEEAKTKGKEIHDVEEIIGDMEQRLLDLRASPATQESLDPASAADALTSGILGSLMGHAPTEQKAILEEAMKGANDLSGMVKRKRKEDTKKQATQNGSSTTTAEVENGISARTRSGKRRMLDVGAEAEDESDASTVSKTKKVRITEDT